VDADMAAAAAVDADMAAEAVALAAAASAAEGAVAPAACRGAPAVGVRLRHHSVVPPDVVRDGPNSNYTFVHCLHVLLRRCPRQFTGSGALRLCGVT
jgi:hypothetical protein